MACLICGDYKIKPHKECYICDTDYCIEHYEQQVSKKEESGIQDDRIEYNVCLWCGAEL